MEKITAHTLAAVLKGHRVIGLHHSTEDIPMGAFDVYMLADGCLVVDCFEAPEPCVELYADADDRENSVASETLKPNER
ncbi:hypothetical protein [Paraburkholderia terrae]|uniref:hypothetical protein n=1 Tax=Paraburkholderia terrae TaxID=311230 RepID=UPI001EE2D230|nr:hypothetical protein [Paraburkholderia terrae]GJH04496.1 hypothetical protein CBA19C8_28085 [Paraburkholderia terrae]